MAPHVCVVPRGVPQATPLLDTELWGAVRCQLSRESRLVLLHRDPSRPEGQLARTYLLHPESLITTGNLAACVFGLQTSLVLDYTIRSTADEKGKRNPPQTCLHKMLSASTGLTASLERAAAKLQDWFGLMEPHSWTPGLGLPAPLGGLCGAVDL